MLSLILSLLLLVQAAPTDTEKLLASVPENRAAECQAVLGERDAAKRAAAVTNLTRHRDPSLLPFLLKLADTDSSAAVRRVIVDRIGRYTQPEVLEMLEQRATSDPDAKVAILALDRLRTLRDQQLASLFEKRLKMAHADQDEKALDVLVADHQRWATLAIGAVLPSFLQTPPPVFEALPAQASIRVLAFGDFGSEAPAMRKVAAAAEAYHREKPFDLGVTTGDNFYMRGVTGPADPRWKSGWEQLYGPMGVPIFATLGNHDWGYPDSPAGEILYSGESRTWRMPALFYSYTAGPAQFFALDTSAISETQLRWLDRELARSHALWKIVYGHHPIYSQGSGHGDSPRLQRTLLPLLRHRADVYLAGHDHDLQYLQPVDGVHFIVSGGGGAGIRPVKPGPRGLFGQMTHGFVTLEMDSAKMKVALVNCDGEVVYQTVIRKEQTSE